MPQIKGQSFDIVLLFKDGSLNPEMYIDENVKDALEYLLKEHKKLILKVNWFSKGLKIIDPDGGDNTDVALQEGPQSTET